MKTTTVLAALLLATADRVRGWSRRLDRRRRRVRPDLRDDRRRRGCRRPDLRHRRSVGQLRRGQVPRRRLPRDLRSGGREQHDVFSRRRGSTTTCTRPRCPTSASAARSASISFDTGREPRHAGLHRARLPDPRVRRDRTSRCSFTGGPRDRRCRCGWRRADRSARPARPASTTTSSRRLLFAAAAAAAAAIATSCALTFDASNFFAPSIILSIVLSKSGARGFLAGLHEPQRVDARDDDRLQVAARPARPP